jgi:hypothetical protein
MTTSVILLIVLSLSTIMKNPMQMTLQYICSKFELSYYSIEKIEIEQHNCLK